MRPWRAVSLVAVGVGLSAAAASVMGWTARAASYEEPAYTTQRSTSTFDVRTYAPVVEAQVTVSGAYGEAVSSAFRVLAGYIFGGNQPRASIAMTTPVSASPSSTRIAMTTPVSATAGDAGWTVSFTMPSTWSLETLPVPNDARIRLVEVPSGTWVVAAFSGRATDGVVETKLAELRRDAEVSGLKVIGPPVVAQFDPPWVLGPWRRNEVRWPVEAPPS